MSSQEGFETQGQESNQEGVKPVAVKFDTFEPGHPGATIFYSDGTSNWVDARVRRDWEEANKIPEEQRIDNLPQRTEE